MFRYIVSLSHLVALTSALALSHSPAKREGYSPDIDEIMSTDPSTFKSYPASVLPRGASNNNNDSNNSNGETDGPEIVAHWWTCTLQAQFTYGDNYDDRGAGGPGIFITNGDRGPGYRGFYVYHNGCDSVPYKYIWVAAGATQFLALPPLFEGRVTRGVDAWNLHAPPQTIATWLELALDARGWAWGDVSLIRGCDGGAVLWAVDGSGSWKGFAESSVLVGAPPEAYTLKNDGALVLRETTNWDGTINPSVRDWEGSRVGFDYVYVDDFHGNPVIASVNGRFGTYWPAGRA